MKLTSDSYRCDVCQGVSAPEYVRGWIGDGDREIEVEPHLTSLKHVCVTCEVRGVYYLGMPPASVLARRTTSESSR